MSVPLCRHRGGMAEKTQSSVPLPGLLAYYGEEKKTGPLSPKRENVFSVIFAGSITRGIFVLGPSFFAAQQYP